MAEPKNTPPSPLLIAKPPSLPDQGGSGSLYGMIMEGAEPLEIKDNGMLLRGMAMDSTPEKLSGFIDFSEHWEPPSKE